MERRWIGSRNGRLMAIGSTSSQTGTASAASGPGIWIQKRSSLRVDLSCLAPARFPLSLLHIPNTGNVSICPIGDKLIFAMGELSGNIWMTDLRQK